MCTFLTNQRNRMRRNIPALRRALRFPQTTPHRPQGHPQRCLLHILFQKQQKRVSIPRPVVCLGEQHHLSSAPSTATFAHFTSTHSTHEHSDDKSHTLATVPLAGSGEMTVDEMDLKMRIAKRAFLMAELTQLCPEREEELNDLATLSDDQQTDRWFEIWTNLDASIRRTIMRSYRAAGQSGELAELAETQSSSPSSLSQSSSSSSQIGHLNLANPAERPIHHAFWHKLEEEVEAGTEQEAVENKVGILNLMAQDFELIHYKGFTLMTHLEHSELIQHSHSHAGITDQDHPKQFFGMAKIGYHATVPSFIRYQSELYNEAEFTQQETNRQSMTDMLYKRIDAHVATHPEHDMKGDVSPEVLKTKKQFDFFRTRISDEEQMRILDQEFAPMWNKIKKIHDEMEAALEKGKSKLGMSKKKRE